MKISRLRLLGFKSFVEPTELVIEAGLTGVVGPNGCGKTTLLKCMLGELEPDDGRAALGTGVLVGYFDQLLACLDPHTELVEVIRPAGKEFVLQQRRDLLARFGLSGDMVFQPVRSLSGGERNRAALARDYGCVRDFQRPKPFHPDSILWRSNYRALNEKGEILHDRKVQLHLVESGETGDDGVNIFVLENPFQGCLGVDWFCFLFVMVPTGHGFHRDDPQAGLGGFRYGRLYLNTMILFEIVGREDHLVR